MNTKAPHVAICLLSCLATMLPARAIELDDMPPAIEVTGEGRVSARPDMAQIQIGVTTDAPTAQEALRKNSDAMASLLKTLQAKGISDKDILTSNFSVNPQYRYDNPSGRSQLPVLTGYTVNNSVHTKVRKIADLGMVMDAVVASGANNINGISFSQANPEPLLDQARRNAIKDAERKAQIYAVASGIKAGKVLWISETGSHFEPPRPMMMSARAESAGVPISAGEQELSASVNVIFEIDRGAESQPKTGAKL
jgi:uncharacterized protein YggE